MDTPTRTDLPIYEVLIPCTARALIQAPAGEAQAKGIAEDIANMYWCGGSPGGYGPFTHEGYFINVDDLRIPIEVYSNDPDAEYPQVIAVSHKIEPDEMLPTDWPTYRELALALERRNAGHIGSVQEAEQLLARLPDYIKTRR